MSLEWSDFEKSLRRSALKELKASPAAWKDYRREKKKRRWNWLKTIGVWVGFPLICFCLSLVFLSKSTELSGILVAFSMLYGLSLFYIYLSNIFFNVNTHWVFSLLPVTSDDVFDTQTRWGWMISSMFLFCFVGTYLGVFLSNHTLWAAIGLALFYGILQTIILLALTIAVILYRQFSFLTFFAQGGWCFVIVAMNAKPILNAINQFLGSYLLWIPPLGWWLEAPQTTSDWFRQVVLIGMTAGIFILAWRSFKKIKDISAFYQSSTEDLCMAMNLGGTATEEETSPRKLRETKLELSQPLDITKLGFLDQFLLWFLNPREREVVEYLTAGILRWTQWFMKFAIGAAIVVAASFLIQATVPKLSLMLSVMSAVFFLMAFVGQWPGLTTTPGRGYQPPYYAFFPVSLQEIAKVMLKINLLRYLFCLPLALIVAAILVHQMSDFHLDYLSTLLKITLFGFAIHPLVVVLKISAGTNDTKRFWPIMIFLLFLPAIVLSSIILIVAPSLHATLIAGTIMNGSTYGFQAVYIWLLSHYKIDLIPSNSKD